MHHKWVVNVLEVIDLSAQFSEFSRAVQQAFVGCTPECLDVELAAACDSGQLAFLNLCEATSKRIANTQEPTTIKQIEKLAGTVEGTLVREAMLDEIMGYIRPVSVLCSPALPCSSEGECEVYASVCKGRARLRLYIHTPQ